MRILIESAVIAAVAIVVAGSEMAPIWYARIPSLGEYDVHKTAYLHCKQAHGGRDRWTVRVENSNECSKCFCLPDTQRIGCMRTSNCGSTSSSTGQPTRHRVRRNSGTGGSGLYVNHEACVRANSGRTFTRGSKHCVCRQDGGVGCVDSQRARPALY
ncbi:hypothetical protein GGI04_001481 [Coemansia thaxteri]|nr:hypothetical protein GGI04_001481 [Coemansia thaxteri]KAJ2472473.1 hypothetical protein GGI02_001559 [Coemansia sp. RSA 2322]